MTTTLDITPFLDAFEDHPDEFWRFGVIADAFADVGDEVGEEWARFVLKWELKTYVTIGVSSGKEEFYWNNSMIPKQYESDQIPALLDRHCDKLIRKLFGKLCCPTAKDAWFVLLDSWRQSSEEELGICHNWRPPLLSRKPHPHV